MQARNCFKISYKKLPQRSHNIPPLSMALWRRTPFIITASYHYGGGPLSFVGLIPIPSWVLPNTLLTSSFSPKFFRSLNN